MDSSTMKILTCATSKWSSSLTKIMISKNHLNFRYYNCVHGYPHIYDCPPPLIFDEAQGTCVREEQASSFARKCEKEVTKANIEGFECPEGETIGPNGIPLAHPSFPHPTSCRKYIVCEFSTTPKELGCTDGLVFDHINNKCVNPEDGPEDWYVDQ